MNTAQNMYNLDLYETEGLLAELGQDITFLITGDMGQGKSSLLDMLSERFPEHVPVYFDATNKDLGDMALPDLNSANDGYVRFVPNEEMGLHLNKPVIVMVDEYGKANPSVKNALNLFMYERKMGGYKLHPDSIVFATTNKSGEGVGDILQPHQYNRITEITLRKLSHMDWIEWGISNGIDHLLLAWVKDNPQLFYPWENVKDPDENEFIFHPKAVGRKHFFTPRSGEKASRILQKRAHLSDVQLTAALIGTIGQRGAKDLMAFIRLADKLPTLQSIKDDPKNALVPDTAAAKVMVVYRTLASLEKDWLNAWMDYLDRLDPETQGLFANNVASPKYSKQSMVMTNKKFTDWAMANNYMFAADKV